MKKKILITGGSGGIGSACQQLLCTEYDIYCPDRSELNFSDIASVENFDTKNYDIIINCIGSNKGTYLGFEGNLTLNQIDQINTNYVSPLILLKNFINKNNSGHFIYISSISIHRPKYYNIVGASSKFALKFAIDEIAKNKTNFTFTEVCPGKTKTNMLYQNYCGSKSRQEVEEEYNQSSYLQASQVAETIKYCIDNKITNIQITP